MALRSLQNAGGREYMGDFVRGWTLRRVKGPLGPLNLEGVPVVSVPSPCSSSGTVRLGLLVVGTDVKGY